MRYNLYRSILTLIALACVLAFSAAIAEDSVADLARARGFAPDTVSGDGAEMCCDYQAKRSDKAVMSWTDGSGSYSIDGKPADVAQLYVDALALGGWQICRYTVGKRVRICYNGTVGKKCDTLEDYIIAMESALGVTVTPMATETPAPTKAPAVVSDERQYVLNTSTHKFHYPSCPSVGKIKEKNRQDVTVGRDALIARGYKPCGSCNP